MIQKIQKILTKRQETMLFVMLEDTKGKIEVLVFPKVLERIGSVWEEERMIIAEGRLSDKDGVYKLIVDEAKELNRSEIENYLRVEATKKTYGVKDEDDNNKNDPPTPSGDSGNQQQIIDNNPATQATRKLIITLPRNATPEIIHNLSKFFNTCAIGQCKVFLHHQENKLETPFSIEHSPTLLDEIKKIVNGGNAELA
ncbi:MAG: polymerase III subunit alpha protein [Candidatus Moranbacteria bacterium GW2011_GWD2_36_198]|nr:MAG: polymerase III subunit alpha protein [Candidatus Moranbacteria bacterium GW2011_GWD2_36_198]